MSKHFLQPITIEDTEFIFFLRSISKSCVLKSTNREKHVKFIREHLIGNEGGYYKFCNSDEVVGYYRWLNNDDKIEIGSWITNPASGFMEKVLFDMEFKNHVFNETQAEFIYFDVERNNSSVWKHHERLGAELINEDSMERKYRLNKKTFILKYNEKINRINKRSI